MGRIRTIKPSFFKHEELFEAEKASGLPLRVAFSGLWTVCDRDGRFAWKPRTLKTDVMPYDDVDFGAVLDALVKSGFVVRYTVDGREYGSVPSWGEHQVINSREAASAIPAHVTHVHAHEKTPRVDNLGSNYNGEGKGREKEGKESAIDPEMVTRGVLSELCLSGRDLAVAMDEVCRAEMKQGRDPADLRDALIASWKDYTIAKPSLNYPKGAVKFFGEGDWRDKAGWPWKDGKQPVPAKRVYANA